MRLDPEFDKFYDVVINESNEIISNEEDIIIRKKVFIPRLSFVTNPQIFDSFNRDPNDNTIS
jgi:hypothetical protein